MWKDSIHAFLFIRIYFIRILRLKFSPKLRIFLEYSEARSVDLFQKNAIEYKSKYISKNMLRIFKAPSKGKVKNTEPQTKIPPFS